MKKVLIITYYWPPSGGSGVQRWLKFSKYLPEYGYEPIVLTPENPSFINKDPGLLDEVPKDIEVLKLPIWEPYQVLARLSRKEIHQKNVNVGQKQTFFQKISLWIRGNMFIPDPRMFWVRPVVKFL
ncbi:MAG: glycosyl transferase, partial [Cyclobacteriaceae bacterium]|nr:glycosyl transferase [Cyclobacteriaceae bacterium]